MATLIYNSALEVCVDRLMDASFSIRQAMNIAEVKTDDGLSIVISKLLVNVLEASHGNTPHIEYDADKFVYTTSGGLTFGITASAEYYEAFIVTGDNRTSTLFASAWLAGFRPISDTATAFDGYSSTEANRRIAASKAADAFNLLREDAYQLLMDASQKRHEEIKAFNRKNGTVPSNEAVEYEEEDEYDIDRIAAETLRKLRSSKLFG